MYEEREPRPQISARDATFVPDVQLEKLVRQYPTPFYLYDEAGIRHATHRLREAFSWNPGYRQWYCMRANPNPSILRIMREEGFGVVCTTAGEVQIAERSGFLPEMINFSLAFPTEAEMQAVTGLRHVVLDDADLMIRLERREVLPDSIALRYNPGGKFGSRAFSRAESSRFGMQKQTLLRAVRELRLKGVRDIGLMAQLADNNQDPEYLPALAKMLFTLAAELKRDEGIHVRFCNLGDGVGIAQRAQDAVPDIAAISRGIRAHFEQILVPAGLGDCAIHTQLDRFLVGHSGILLTTVTDVKHGSRDCLAVDMTRAELLRPLIYGSFHHVSVLNNHQNAGRQRYIIADRIAETKEPFGMRMLPECQRGSVLVFHDVGAYGHSMGYQYCSIPCCAEYLLKPDGSTVCIRRAETQQEMFAAYDCNPDFALKRTWRKKDERI